jgi:uncharacterized membrane protein (DUF2068 family)
MEPRNGRLVVAIGVFKLVKVVLLVTLGVAGLVAMPEQLADAAERAVVWLGASSARETLERAIGDLSSMDVSTVHRLAALSFVYAGAFLVEGLGLVRRRRWAEWLTVVVTGSFIPLELYELATHFRPGKLFAVALNVAIVVYLAWRRIRERRGRGAPARGRLVARGAA